jgi:hypothetical protein
VGDVSTLLSQRKRLLHAPKDLQKCQWGNRNSKRVQRKIYLCMPGILWRRKKIIFHKMFAFLRLNQQSHQLAQRRYVLKAAPKMHENKYFMQLKLNVKIFTGKSV